MLLTTFQTARHHLHKTRCEKYYKNFDWQCRDIWGEGVWLGLFEGINLSQVKN